MRKFFAKFRFASIGAATFLSISALDLLSTTLGFHFLTGIEEGNPYVRDAARQFMPIQHIGYNGIWFVFLVAVAITFYYALKDLGEDSTVARIAAGIPFFYESLSGIGAIIHNCMLALGWYQP